MTNDEDWPLYIAEVLGHWAAECRARFGGGNVKLVSATLRGKVAAIRVVSARVPSCVGLSHEYTPQLLLRLRPAA